MMCSWQRRITTSQEHSISLSSSPEALDQPYLALLSVRP